MIKLIDKYAKNFVTEDEMKSAMASVSLADQKIVRRTGDGSEFLGWYDLPDTYDRDEVERIKATAEKIKKDEININDITENLISENLYTTGIPEPDMIIRTGGDYRISNYLLWQCAYTEIYVTEEFWPEVDKNSLANAVNDFAHRQRRFGK